MRNSLQKLLICFLFLICQRISSAQNFNVFKDMFDRTQKMVEDAYPHQNRNLVSGYGDGLSYYMTGCLVMFEATRDIKYLDDFIRVSNEIIANRDDNSGYDQKRPYWTTEDRKDCVSCPGQISYQTALIMSPMAQYVFFSRKEHKQLFSNNLPATVITFDGQKHDTYVEYAQWLYGQIKITWEYYDTYHWINDQGYIQYFNDKCYQECGYECFKNSENVEELDRNCNWGVLNAHLAMAFEGEQEGVLYFDHVQTLGYLLKDHILNYTIKNGQCGNCYIWSRAGWSGLTAKIEDISHAAAAIEFAYFLNQYKNYIKSSPGGVYSNGYFSDYDMTLFANSLNHLIYKEPLTFYNYLDKSCYEGTNSPSCDNYVKQYGLGRWLYLSKFQDPIQYSNTLNKVYPSISDFFSTMHEKPSLTYSVPLYDSRGKLITEGGSKGNTILGIALAAKHQGMFKFIGRNSGPGGAYSNDWQGVASGDFDNDGIKNDVISVRNSDGGFFFWKILTNYSTTPTYDVDYSNVGYNLAPLGSVITGGVATGVNNSYWKGITVGHFVNDIPGDQIAAIRESDGAIFIWKPVFNSNTYEYSLVSILANNSTGTGNGWIGITSGDFDNDGIDEFASIREIDGGIYVWKVYKNPNGTYYINAILVNNTSGTNNKWAALCAGDINNDGIDELAAVRNVDGSIFIWKLVNNSGVYSLVSVGYNNSSGSGNIWNGMTIGDFDNDGLNELVMHRNFDGAFFVYDLVGSNIVGKGLSYFPVEEGIRNFTTAKLPDHNNDIIVSCRNYDGDIMLYALDFNASVMKVSNKSELKQNSNLDQNLKVYPNPTNSNIKISIDGASLHYQVRIINISGIQVYVDSDYQNNTDINTFEFTNGIYFVEIIDENGQRKRSKFVKL